MDVKSIINIGVNKAGITINPAQGRKLINEAMAILAAKYDTACIKKLISYTATINNSEFDLPANCIGVLRVKDSLGNKFKRYIADSTSIRFNALDTFIVEYLTMPELISKENYDYTIGADVPPINLSYHVVIPFYLASITLMNDDEENLNKANMKLNKANSYMQEFYSLSEDINKKLNSTKRKSINIPAPQWR